ncbi:hypothetical protein ACS0TY_001946 [Phlomoides rotata]
MENSLLDTGHSESGHSSPRTRENEFENPPTWEDPQGNYKVKFMCSYDGKIQPRAHDNQLSYIGGDTKILAVDRNIKFDSLLPKVIDLCGGSVSISIKYQLPGEDLDALITVMNDDDLEHLMHEYDRLHRISPKAVRMRIFVFPSQSRCLNSPDQSFRFDDAKTEKERFVEELNSASIFTAPQKSAPAANNVDYLFGFDKANVEAAAPPTDQGKVRELEDQVITLPGLDGSLIGSDHIQKHIQDLERLRIEEQEGIYKMKNDESFSGGSDYNKLPDKLSQIPVPCGVPYWNEKQLAGGVFPEQQFYIIPANAYHAAMMRPVNGSPTQGFYTVQRIPAGPVYQDQIYNMIPQGAVPSVAAAHPMMQPQKVTGYSGGVGVMTEAGAGRQVIYPAPGGVMGAPAAQYQGLAATVSADMRPAGVLNVEAAVKVAPKATQASV